MGAVIRPYSITSSASASNLSGMSSRRSFAVLRLMTSSNLIGACTGRSPGLAPRRLSHRLGGVGSIRNQAAGRCKETERINRRQAVLCRYCDDQLAINYGECIRQNDETAIWLLRKVRNRGLNLRSVANGELHGGGVRSGDGTNI
jgi:hypothetical protein